MKITYTPEQTQSKPPTYPYLGQHQKNGRAVLFIAPRVGLCVQGAREFHTGEVNTINTNWHESDFYSPCHGTVTFTA